MIISSRCFTQIQTRLNLVAKNKSLHAADAAEGFVNKTKLKLMLLYQRSYMKTIFFLESRIKNQDKITVVYGFQS